MKQQQTNSKMNKKLIWQGVFTLAIVGIVALIFIYDPFSGNSEDDFSDIFKFEGIKTDNVTKIRIEKKDSTIKLEIDNDKWFVSEKKKDDKDYSDKKEADQGKVETIITSTGEAEVVKKASTNVDNHDRFEVDDEKGVKVTFYKADKELEQVVVGKYAAGGSTYVREQGKDSVYEINKDITEFADYAVGDWEMGEEESTEE